MKNTIVYKVVCAFVFCLYGVSINAKTLYVSSSVGNDNNTGIREDIPLSTIRKAISIADTIYLHAGDIFYETLNVNGKYLSRYGEGTNPTICGYRRLNSPRWEFQGNHVWKLNLLAPQFTGFPVIQSSMSNNICCIHEYDRDLIHGRKVRYRREMKSNWDFWQTEKINDAVSSDYDSLYLYYTGDPNKLDLEFSVYDTGIVCSNCTIDGINLVGFGFGVSAKEHSIIKRCRVDAIGGRMVDEGWRYTCYGNGIEFYVSRNIHDCLVEDCYVSRCYDCGITIQASERGEASPKNIIIRNNLISQCCEGWEDFLRNDPDVVYENCVFESNTIVNSGDSGWGYPASRFKYCHVLGNNVRGNKGMIIRNNTFAGGNYYCSGAYQGKYASNVWENNVCYIQRGDFILGNYTGTKDVIRIPIDKGYYKSLNEATKVAIKEYRMLTGDMTTKFVICSPNSIKRKARKLENKYIAKNK